MSLDHLLACAGSWRGTSKLRDPDYGIDDECSSGLIVSPAIRNRFVRLDYTWSYRDEPQEGSLLVGFDPKSDRYSAHWADTWHNAHGVMTCEGIASEDGGLSVLGSYAAPPGPDWGWRIDLTAHDDGMLRVTMFNISPEGHEELAVEGVYFRA
jgi:hypothetical protein